MNAVNANGCTHSLTAATEELQSVYSINPVIIYKKSVSAQMIANLTITLMRFGKRKTDARKESRDE